MDDDAQNVGIMETAEKYFDGMHRSDGALLRDVFHPFATVIGYGGDGTLKTMTLDDFLEFMATVPTSEAESEFDMSVLSIDRSGKVASIKVHDLFLNRDFIDYLHMVETPDGWKITAKAFHSDPRE